MVFGHFPVFPASMFSGEFFKFCLNVYKEGPFVSVDTTKET